MHLGSGGSARAAAVDRLVREHWGHALLVVPTRAHARGRREELILGADCPGVWGEPVYEFNDFARRLLEAEGRIVRIVDDFARRLLIETRIEALVVSGSLGAVGAAARQPGFANHVLRVITQLKQAAVEPTAFRERIRDSARGIDTAVAAAYEAYQGALLAAGVYDMPGLFWEANVLCRTRRPRALDGVALLAFDGFDDFTPSQMRLLEGLAPHVTRLVIGLNCDVEPDRQDLYAIPAAAARALHERFRPEEVTYPEPEPVRSSEYAARRIFWRNPPVFPAGLAADLTIIPCADPTHEAESIARRVKALLTEQRVAPGEIAVVYRRLGDIAPMLRAVFGECGVPVRLVEPESLSETGLGMFLLRLFDAWARWERESVVETLLSPWFGARACEDAATEAFPLLARTAGVIAGYEEWLYRIEGLRADIARGGMLTESLRAHVPEAAAHAEALDREIRVLAALRDRLPGRARQAVLAAAFGEVLDALVMEAGADAPEPDDVRDARERANAALRALLIDMAAYAPDEPVTRDAFLDRLRDGMRATACAVPAPDAAVQVLDAAGIRNLQFDHVFLAGLNEGEFPLPPPLNAIYSESDLRDLRARDIALEGHAAQQGRERLLFHHALETARAHLTLTWRLQGRSGKEAARSPFLAEIIELFPADAGLCEAPPRSDSFVPEPDAVACPRDLQLCAFFRAEPLRRDFADLFADIESGAEIERSRGSSQPFDAYDGVLAAEDLVCGLAAHFDGKYLFSASRLETYIACPFRFFQEEILGVEVTEGPEAEFDALVRGTILHDALRAFHEEFRGQAPCEIDEEAARDAMARAVAAAFAAHGNRAVTAPAGVLAMERRRMEVVLERYLHLSRQEEVLWRPAHFEVSFGGGRSRSGASQSIEEPYVMETPGGPVRFSGRIDRIDSGAEGVIRLIDYKTGGLPGPGEIKDGSSIQLGLYALAVEDIVLPGAMCAEARYVQPGRKKTVEVLSKKKEWPEREAALRKAVTDAVARIRQASFPPTAKKEACRGCGSARACRYERARIERKPGASVIAGDDDEE